MVLATVSWGPGKNQIVTGLCSPPHTHSLHPSTITLLRCPSAERDTEAEVAQATEQEDPLPKRLTKVSDVPHVCHTVGGDRTPASKETQATGSHKLLLLPRLVSPLAKVKFNPTDVYLPSSFHVGGLLTMPQGRCEEKNTGLHLRPAS